MATVFFNIALYKVSAVHREPTFNAFYDELGVLHEGEGMKLEESALDITKA